MPSFNESVWNDSDRGNGNIDTTAHRAFDGVLRSATERIECVLAAGAVSDLPALRAWCDALPVDSYGQVFIEVFSPIQIEDLHAPVGLNVTWLCRELLDSVAAPGTRPAHGEALVAAADAWLNEWYRPASGIERHFTMWLGAHSTEVVHNYWKHLEDQTANAPGDPRR